MKNSTTPIQFAPLQNIGHPVRRIASPDSDVAEFRGETPRESFERIKEMHRRIQGAPLVSRPQGDDAPVDGSYDLPGWWLGVALIAVAVGALIVAVALAWGMK